MINMATITKAVQTILTAGSLTVDRQQRVNYDPGRCPWAGVYPGKTNVSEPHTLGSGNNRWMTKATLDIVLQTSSFNTDGQDASDAMSTLINDVLALIKADLTLGITGVMVVGVSRRYMYVQTDKDESGDLFWPQVILTLKMEVKTA